MIEIIAFSFQFTQFLKDVKDGTFQDMVAQFLRGATNNHGFEITWNIDVTVEGVPQEASDTAHAQIDDKRE